jgi:hypothetical protein
MLRAEDHHPELGGVIDAARRLALPDQDHRRRPPAPGTSNPWSAGAASAARQLSEARVLVRRISLWPFVRVDLQGDDVAVHSGVRDTLIAKLNLVTGALTAFVIADTANSLIEEEPLLRATRDGVRLDVTDAHSRMTGERLIRWRIDLERFGAQLGEASP